MIWSIYYKEIMHHENPESFKHILYYWRDIMMCSQCFGYLLNLSFFLLMLTDIAKSTDLQFLVVSTNQNPSSSQPPIPKDESQTCEALARNIKLLKELKEQNMEIKQLFVEIQNTHDKQIGTEIQMKLNNDKTEKLFKEIKQQFIDLQKTQDKQFEIQTKLAKRNKNQLEILKEQITQIQQSLPLLHNLPRDCKELTGDHDSGIYHIQPEFSSEAFTVLCDMKTEGGGWTYFMSRFDGSQNFHLNWTDYKNGFGNLTGEFWLGLQHLYDLTAYKKNELLIELVDWDNKKVQARYTHFGIGKEEEKYQLRYLTGYTGDIRDSFSYHVEAKFSTPDRNDKSNCAMYFMGGWWFHKGCFYVMLTGLYLKGDSIAKTGKQGIYWTGFRSLSYNYSLKEVRMMIRPQQNSQILLPHEKN